MSLKITDRQSGGTDRPFGPAPAGPDPLHGFGKLDGPGEPAVEDAVAAGVHGGLSHGFRAHRAAVTGCRHVRGADA